MRGRCGGLQLCGSEVTVKNSADSMSWWCSLRFLVPSEGRMGGSCVYSHSQPDWALNVWRKALGWQYCWLGAHNIHPRLLELSS